MDRCDVLIVGGGPAGSSCAWRLVTAGLDVVVVDKANFPRDKVCAGWITPAVVRVNGRADAVFQSGAGVFGLDPETGKVRWKGPPDLNGSTIPSPVPGPEGVVLVPGGRLVALKLGPEGTTPEVLWRSARVGGTVTIEDNEPRGSRFVIDLPVARTPATVEA